MLGVDGFDISCVDDDDCALVQDYCPEFAACIDTAVNENAAAAFDDARQDLPCPEVQLFTCPRYDAYCVSGECEACSLEDSGGVCP